MTIRNQAQLITYPDSLGGDLAALNTLLRRHFGGVFGGVHVLPPFPSSGDRGFAPTDYRKVYPAFGSWSDLQAVGESFDLAVDLMVNHLSRRSPEFQDFEAHGRASAHADLFITLDKLWPGGEPAAEDVARIFLRRPIPPFSSFVIGDTGQTERVWTTFGRTEPSEQIDLDINSPLTRQMIVDLLRFFREHGVSIVRLDAVGYVIKERGTSCFMVEPEIYEVLAWLTAEADRLGLTLLSEVHAEPPIQAALAQHGYWVYDFVLPLLVLHSLTSKSGVKLAEYLKTCPRRQFTTLDTHDGIPVQPDLTGLLTVGEMRAVVEHCLARGANVSRLLVIDGQRAPELNAHQINITYYSALDANDAAYLTARALQIFAPGIPQIYYVGLLTGSNDPTGVVQTGDGRAINRHNYSVAEVEAALSHPIVERLMHLLRMRNTHAAFMGDLTVLEGAEHEVRLERRNGDAWARLEVDLRRPAARITYSDDTGGTVEEQIGR